MALRRDVRRMTEIGNRTRIAAWMRQRCSAANNPMGPGNNLSVLIATNSEQSLRTRKGLWSFKITLIDGYPVHKTTPFLNASGGEQQLSSEYGRWERAMDAFNQS